MAKKRTVTNPLGLAVLAYSLMKPMHPYEMGQTLKRHGDDRSIKYNHGSLYMVIKQLHKAGFLSEVETTREGNMPERTVYAITDAGRAELRDWLRELIAEPQTEYPAFVTALSLISALPPDEAAKLLRQRLAALAEQRDEIRIVIDTAVRDGVRPLFLVEEEYRLAVTDAETAFIEKFLRDMRAWEGEWAQFHRTRTADQE